jgi:hypothetical protein
MDAMADTLTDDEKRTLKTAAFGAVFLVANADPGFFSMLRESFAASGALAGSTGLVKEVVTAGALPKLPKDSPEQVEAAVLPALRQSVQILAAKAPAELENYRTTVLAAADRVANASEGVSAREAEMLAKVRDALGVPT